MNCPHCNTKLEKHGPEGLKAGAQHCEGCGCCFEKDGETVRPGHPLCKIGADAEAAQAGAELAESEPEAPKGVTDVPVEVTKGAKVAEEDEVPAEDSPTPERRGRR